MTCWYSYFKYWIKVGFMVGGSWLLTLGLRAEDISLKDGRILMGAEVVSQSPLSVMVKHRDGISSVKKVLLPDTWAAQYPVDQKAATEAKALQEKATVETRAKELARSETKEAATNGDANSQYAVGEMFFKGDGVPRDIVESTKWFRQAAEQGDNRAECKLGHLYETGEGLSRDFREAYQWYCKAAEQNNVDAQSCLGFLYQKGLGVTRNDAEAVKWFRRAAEQGNVPAQKQMASACAGGVGLPKDPLEALAWVSVAANGGDQEFKQLRNYLLTQYNITQSMVVAAQLRSNELLKIIAVNKAQGTERVPKSKIAPPEASGAKGNGSGVIVSTSGYILTAAHVVKDCTKVIVITAQGARSAKVVKSDGINDVAILKLEEGAYPARAVAPSNQVRLGQAVATIGFPSVNVQGFSPKVTRGEINSLNGAGDDPRRWQFSAPVQPGNSGGPLLDENGNVIGVVVSRLVGEMAQNVNYAIKSAYALELLKPYLVESVPLAITGNPPPRFEDMVADVQRSVVLILIY